METLRQLFGHHLCKFFPHKYSEPFKSARLINGKWKKVNEIQCKNCRQIILAPKVKQTFDGIKSQFELKYESESKQTARKAYSCSKCSKQIENVPYYNIIFSYKKVSYKKYFVSKKICADCHEGLKHRKFKAIFLNEF